MSCAGKVSGLGVRSLREGGGLGMDSDADGNVRVPSFAEQPV